MRLKSAFVSLFLVAMTVALIHAAWMLLQQPASAAWWAVMLAVAPPALFFVRVYARPIARTSAVMWPILVLAVAGVGLLVLSGSRQPLPWLYAAGIGLGGSLVYQFWYSRFGRRASSLLAQGMTLPPMAFETAEGRPVRTDALPGALLLIFYRGNWCPLCMAQIGEVAKQYRELAARGVQVLLISSQPPGHTASLARKFDVDFLFLVDRDNRVTRQLGLLAKNGTPLGLQVLGYGDDTAMPTVILTDAGQRIIFCDQTDNYRVRPEPETFLKLLDGVAA